LLAALEKLNLKFLLISFDIFNYILVITSSNDHKFPNHKFKLKQ